MTFNELHLQVKNLSCFPELPFYISYFFGALNPSLFY